MPITEKKYDAASETIKKIGGNNITTATEILTPAISPFEGTKIRAKYFPKAIIKIAQNIILMAEYEALYNESLSTPYYYSPKLKEHLTAMLSEAIAGHTNNIDRMPSIEMLTELKESIKAIVLANKVGSAEPAPTKDSALSHVRKSFSSLTSHFFAREGYEALGSEKAYEDTFVQLDNENKGIFTEELADAFAGIISSATEREIEKTAALQKETSTRLKDLNDPNNRTPYTDFYIECLPSYGGKKATHKVPEQPDFDKLKASLILSTIPSRDLSGASQSPLRVSLLAHQ